MKSDADVTRYRREAEECRRLAAKTANTIEKQKALRLAEEWLKLAQTRLAGLAPAISGRGSVLPRSVRTLTKRT